ncbi:Flp family type IVb pilin [Erythrobacter cryptus]|uniref:Flp family type IVb pilin n=1 Tax=Erythrobacter cryptus TaxID=196588 RepID=UPI00040ADE65|nr:Flp family type IVb pilin [Erythrobacter cryptus]
MVPRFIRDLSDDTSGATAIEYSLIAALIAIAIVGSVTGFAGEAYELWGSIDSDVDDAIGSGPTTPPPD